MSDYKWNNADNTAIIKYPKIHINEGAKGWGVFQTYLAAGGQVDPWKTDIELLEEARTDKLLDLSTERDGRVDSVMGTNDIKKKLKAISRGVKLLKKKYENRATTLEIQELDDQESVDDYVENVNEAHETSIAWLKNEARTLIELNGYDVISYPTWPVYGS